MSKDKGKIMLSYEIPIILGKKHASWMMKRLTFKAK